MSFPISYSSIFKSGTPDHPHSLHRNLEQTSPPSNHKSGPHIPEAQHLYTSVPNQFLMKLFWFIWVPHCLSLHKRSANEFWILFPFYFSIINSQTHSHSFIHSYRRPRHKHSRSFSGTSFPGISFFR